MPDTDPYLVPLPDPNRDALSNPKVRDFLDKISQSEGADYNTLVGGKKINDLSRHPNVVGLRTSAGPSTAFGRYQITGTTDKSKLAKYRNLDYSPENQDLRAVELLRQTGALDALNSGDEQTAIKRAGREWASIPGSPLPGRKSSAFQQPKQSIPKFDDWVQQTTQQPVAATAFKELNQQPQTQPRTRPKVTSTIKDDTGAEVPTVEPIKFQQSDNSELNKLARGVQGLTDRVSMQGMELPKNHPDLVGQRVAVTFNHQPTQEEIDSAVMENLGAGFGGIAKKFREETGTSLTGNNVSVDQQADGSYLVHARPSQGFIDAVNAYAKGGRSAYENVLASQTVGRGAVARDIKANQEQGIGQDVGQAGAREIARNAQFMQNAASLATGQAPEDNPNARAISRAEQSVPSQKTWAGSAFELPLSAAGAINRAEALGGTAGFPASAALENLQRGPTEAYKSGVLTAPMLAAGPIAKAVGADEMGGLGRQVTMRGLAGAGMAAPAVATGASPKEVGSAFLQGAAFPTGERGESERPTELGIRHVDLQRRLDDGTFGKETKAEREARQSQVAATEAPTEQSKLPVPQSTPELQPPTAVSPQKPLEAVESPSPAATPQLRPLPAKEPPVADGYTRLYRGTSGPSDAVKQGSPALQAFMESEYPEQFKGRWVSPDKNYARAFSKTDADISYVDIPTRDLAKHSAEGLPGTEGLLQEPGKEFLYPAESRPETKLSKLAQGVEAKAVEAGLTEGFKDLPEYSTIKLADQAERAVKLLNDDPDLAKQIATGKAEPPQGLHPESVFIALENRAIQTGDVQMMEDLARGPQSVENSIMGQRLRILGERNPASPVKAIADIEKARSASVPKEKVAQTVNKIKTEIDVELKKAAPKVGAWAKFLDEVMCR